MPMAQNITPTIRRANHTNIILGTRRAARFRASIQPLTKEKTRNPQKVRSLTIAVAPRTARIAGTAPRAAQTLRTVATAPAAIAAVTAATVAEGIDPQISGHNLNSLPAPSRSAAESP